MKPSRELDALIAERVMGHVVSKDLAWQVTYNQADALVETTVDHTLRRALQPYSTDISAAWSVVEKLKAIMKPYDFHIEITSCSEHPEEWQVGVEWFTEDEEYTKVRHGMFYSLSDSAAHSICLAALKVVGVEA